MPAGIAARFGHSASVSGGVMYVYGGYLHGSSEATTEILAYTFATGQWTLIGPRADNFMEGTNKSYIADPADAIMFPAALPSARFSAVATVAGTSPALYLVGGADSTMSSLADFWKFSIADKKWTLCAADARKGYDAAGVAVESYIAVFGGYSDGTFSNELHYMWAGDSGL